MSVKYLSNDGKNLIRYFAFTRINHDLTIIVKSQSVLCANYEQCTTKHLRF